MGTKKGQVRKTARRAYAPKKKKTGITQKWTYPKGSLFGKEFDNYIKQLKKKKK